MSSPEQIERDIERTQASLNTDVDRLSKKVSPGKVVGRRIDRIKGTASSVKERVMGPAPSNAVRSASGAMGSGLSQATDTVSSAKDSVNSAASTVGDAASAAPQSIRQQTQGNPFAAGLIAFGIGWLVSSLPPATEREQDMAKIAAEKGGELAEPLKDTAQQMASDMQEPLQRSVEQVKSVTTDAATQTTDRAKSAATDIKEPLQP